MSEATEKARQEAERVEREEREREAAEAAAREGIVDIDALADDGPTEEQIEAMAEEKARHLNTLLGIMGPASAMFTECDKCDGSGLKPRGPEPKQLDRFRTCPTCDGFGRVLTGAQDTAEWQVQCPGCGGRGFQERTGQPSTAAAPAPVAQATEEEWGVPSWMGDPNIRPVAPAPAAVA